MTSKGNGEREGGVIGRDESKFVGRRQESDQNTHTHKRQYKAGEEEEGKRKGEKTKKKE